MPAPKPSSVEDSGEAAPADGARPRRRWLRWLIGGALGLVLLVVALGAGAYVFVGRYDFAGLAAGRASAALGRRVAIDSLRIGPGAFLSIEARGIRLDNAAAGSRPLMLEVAQVTLEVEALSLLRGPAMVRAMTINGMDLLLERSEEGIGNWKMGPPRPARTGPPDRSWFPTLLDARLNGSEIAVRTTSGKTQRIRLDQAEITTPAVDQPVHMTIAGAYNGTPVTLDAGLQPITVLRDASIPYGTKLHFTSGDTTLDFDGTMTDPLNVDGAKGRLALDAPTLKTVLALAGVASDRDASLKLAGPFERQGDVWTLTEAAGTLDDSRISEASLKLIEGARGKPDDVTVELAFDRLDLNELLGAGRRGGRSDADISLAVDKSPDPLLNARVTAGKLAYATFRAEDAALEVVIVPGEVNIKELSVSQWGGKLWGSARIQAVDRGGAADRGGHMTADLDADGVDVQQLRQLLGIGPVPLTGKVTAQGVVDATGPTLNAALKTGRAFAVLSMTGGSIAREVVEMASTDVRVLFRKPRGMTAITCLLAALDMRGGVGTVSPLRVRSAEGAIAGYARFDLGRHSIDMTIGSESASTGVFALDIPVRVSGPLANPSVSPAQWSAAGRAQLAAAGTMVNLPPGMQQVARRNRCSGPRS